MIGIVVVSHSPALARAAVDLALEMVHGDRPQIEIAAGAGDGVLGTDAARVMEAIDAASSPDGVLVVMDLGSAILSAEMALELADVGDVPVRLSSAPFVEGLVAAVVRAAGGDALEAVTAEAEAALLPKTQHLGPPERGDRAQGPEPEVTAPTGDAPAAPSVEVAVANPHGLHARPAAALVRAAAEFDATVEISNVSTGSGPADAASMIAIAALGAQQGHTLRIAASGPQADAALRDLHDLVRSGFGEI